MRFGITLAALAATSLAACSLLISTEGLTGNASTSAGDAGDAAVTPSGDASPDGTSPDGGAVKSILLSAGGEHACAVVDGVASCWGTNDKGQIGDGTLARRYSAARVLGLPQGPVTAISAGITHTCAIVAQELWCWGSNGAGELGIGTNTDSPSPKKVSLPSPVTDVSGGYIFTCAVAAGNAYCWGVNSVGQLGDGTKTDRNAPVRLSASSNLAKVSGGNDHACGYAPTGEAYCWGHNDDGAALGNANAGSLSVAPVPVQGIPRKATSISMAGWHGCVTTDDSAVWCWGRGTAGELGNGQTSNSAVAVAVSNLTSSVTAAVTAGGPADGDTTCAIQNGAVFCWGNNQYGRLGDGTTSPRSTPFLVTGLPAAATSVSGGDDFNCAALANGEVRCWGRGTQGQLGDGAGRDQAKPSVVLGL